MEQYWIVDNLEHTIVEGPFDDDDEAYLRSCEMVAEQDGYTMGEDPTAYSGEKDYDIIPTDQISPEQMKQWEEENGPMGEAVEDDDFEAPGKQHRDYGKWMDDVWAYAQQRYNVSAQHLNLMSDKISDAFEYDYSPEEVVDAFFGQKDDMDEGYTMKLKEFFIHEAIWTGDGGRRRGKEDADTWRDRRRDDKATHGHEKDDGREGRWDKIDREAQKNEGPEVGLDKGGGGMKPDTRCPKCGDEFWAGPGHPSEPGYKPTVDCPHCGAHFDEDTVESWAQTVWPAPGNFPKDDDEGFEEPDYQAGKAEWMKGEAFDPDRHKEKEYKQDRADDRRFRSKFDKDDEMAGLADWEKAPKKKVSEAHGENKGGKGSEKQGKEMDRIDREKRSKKSDRAADKHSRMFGEPDPEEEMFFGGKDEDDYVGTMTDPAAGQEFKGGKVDDFGDDALEPALFDPESDVQSVWDERGSQHNPDADVTFPKYDEPKRERGSYWWDDIKDREYKPPEDTARHSDIEKAPSFPDEEAEEIKALLRGKK